MHSMGHSGIGTLLQENAFLQVSGSECSLKVGEDLSIFPFASIALSVRLCILY